MGRQLFRARRSSAAGSCQRQASRPPRGPAAQAGRQADGVLRRGHRERAGGRGAAQQAGDLGRRVGVVVGEGGGAGHARRRRRGARRRISPGMPMPAKANTRRPARSSVPSWCSRACSTGSPAGRDSAARQRSSPISTAAAARGRRGGDRLAQRPGRQHAAVAEPAGAVDDEQRRGPWRASGSAARRP